jgi:uncharacterized repeat protein (TIGR01451 family)
LVAAFLLCASANVPSAVNDWTGIGPAGGTVNKIVYSKTAKTVFLIAVGGFYRSQDGGVSWQLIYSNFFNSPTDLAVDPSDPGRVYVVAQNSPSLYVSTDGGTTMAPLATFPVSVNGAWQIGISPDGSTLYVTSGVQIYCSTDKGQTWKQRTTVGTDANARILKLIASPSDAKTLYVSVVNSTSSQGIYVTHDGAMTWQMQTNTSVSAAFAEDFAINPANPRQVWAAQSDGVWTTSNGGTTWTNVFTTIVSAIAVDPTSPTTLYVGTPYGFVYKSIDAGNTWTNITGNLSAGQLMTLAVSPLQDSHVLVGGIEGVAGSSNAGSTWTIQQAGLLSTTITGLSADPAADRIYINTETGIYYTSMGALTTIPVNNSALARFVMTSTGNTDDAIYISAMNAEPGLLTASLASGLALSADGGATWSQTRPLPSSGSQQFFTIASAPSTPQTLLALSFDALYRTTDGGTQWAQITAGLPAGPYGRLLIAPSDPSIAYVTTPAAGSNAVVPVYKSTDGGATWTASGGLPGSIVTQLLTVDPTAGNVLYGVTAGALLKSSDGGATWTALDWDASAAEGYPVALTVDPLHPQILYAAGVTTVARSVDGGASWQTLRAASALPIWSSFNLIADSKHPGTILVGTLYSGVQQLTVAPDLELTAASVTDPVGVGVDIGFSFYVSNRGPFDATHAIVSLQIPSTARRVSVSATGGGTCTVVGSLATCGFAVLRTGASATIRLNATASTAGRFPVVGNVIGDQPDPSTANNRVTASTSVAVLADLSVTATGSASAQVGGAVSYRLTVNNRGPDAAPGARVTYQLASELTPGVATTTLGRCTISGSGLVTCNLGDLAVAKPVAISVSATAAVAGAAISRAAASSSATDPASANNSAAVTTTVTAPPKSGGGGAL